MPTVTLIIGGAKIPSQVQVDLLCEASPVFKVAFNRNFLEIYDRSMNLPEEAPEVFEQLSNWIYLGNYFNPKCTNTPEDQTIYMFLVKMYVAADKYGILSLENQIMDEWHQVHHLSRKAQPSNSEVIDYAYKTTAPMSNLRKIIVAHYVWEVKHDWYCEDESVTALSERPQFIKELVVDMSRKMSGSHKNPFRTLKSSFQEHGERKDDVPETFGDQVSPETSEDEWTQMDTSVRLVHSFKMHASAFRDSKY